MWYWIRITFIFLISNFSFSQIVIIFCDNNSSSTNADNRKKYVLVLGKGRTKGLNAITTTAESKYSINITRSRKKL